MHMQIKAQITINTNAEKVWRILAHEFEHIDQWAAIINQSSAITNIPAPKEAKISGRICLAQGFGEVQEIFTHYDEQAMRFTYQATKGLPSFFTHVENNWTVHALGPNQSMAESRAEMDLKFFPGLFIAPIFKLIMSRAGNKFTEELKYYVENDQAHPRKLKTLQKQTQKTSTPLS